MSEQPKVVDLGWENGWQNTPQIVADSKVKGHQVQTRNLDPTMHGLDHEVRCDICGYVYHYDSSN